MRVLVGLLLPLLCSCAVGKGPKRLPFPDGAYPDVVSPFDGPIEVEPDQYVNPYPDPDLKRPPDMRRDQPTGPKVLVDCDFETTCSGLTKTKDWACGKLAFSAGSGCSPPKPPTACHSSTSCCGTVLNDCHQGLGNAADACDNKSTTDDSVLKVSVTIPSTAKSATLEYWEWADVYVPFDWTEVRLDDQVAEQHCTGSYSAPTSWAKKTVDLDSYIGKNVAISFHFMATSSVNKAGWYIDDLKVVTE